ncbi:TIGR00341 family protein [Nitrosomonas sp.]|uniref:TIGR00341 family protein n=1 Tax=Nitrosomonas sp. TaxID=42353 RepID=UPI001D929874|nr:TIGR00341 family protein [Nitrosomonas sp.]MBX3616707.1 TIGR00341 family protein [Nitrosomonas sp.]
MKYIEIVVEASSINKVLEIAKEHEASDLRLGVMGDDGMQLIRLLVTDDKIQSVLDSLQSALRTQPSTWIIVLPIEISLPMPSKSDSKEEDSAIETREAIYKEVEKNAALNINFVVLIVLATIVVAIGLIENNVAVVIGGMVIAPLLGSNLAFGLGTALGDFSLMRKSILTFLVGITLAIALSVVIGAFWPLNTASPELVLRTKVGLDSFPLALASGAAAALSLTAKLSSVLVGVMVAVALLPPAVTLGLMLGLGDINHAFNAGLLLTINVVCINLATKIVLLIKGVHPHTWYKTKKAKRAIIIYILAWFVTLTILILVVYHAFH